MLSPKRKYDFLAMFELVEETCDPDHLVKVLEDIDFEYSQYVLKDNELYGASWVADNRFYLREIKEAFRLMMSKGEK